MRTVKCHLVKDKQNKLAVVADEFVLLVDYYTNSDEIPGHFSMNGTYVETLMGRRPAYDLLTLCTDEQFNAAKQLTVSKDRSMLTAMEYRQPLIIRWLGIGLRLLTLDRLNIKDYIPLQINLKPGVLYATGKTVPDFKMLLEPELFDSIKRIPDVKDTYIDIAALWQKNLAAGRTGSQDSTQPLQLRQIDLDGSTG